jgi:serine/threonine protein kinase
MKSTPGQADRQPLPAGSLGERADAIIGRYRLLEQIGEGGFGVVWRAEQVEPVRRTVALKIVKLGMDTRNVIARFEQERQALALMDHPNIAKVLDAGATPEGRPYFVMELVQGVKITDYCDQARLSTEARLALFVTVCHAVQHAHQKGIIHRDLKPSNILVSEEGQVPVPKVIDFGVAKATRQERLTDLTLFTQFEQMIGTPLYMSPEQAELSGLDIDTRSDIYSLGVLLYELLAGRTPFDPEKLMRAGLDEIRRVIRDQEPLKPSTLLSTMALEVPTAVARSRASDPGKLAARFRGDLDWILMKALEKDRSRRYQSAAMLADDLRRHLAAEPVLAHPPSRLYRLQRTMRRNKAICASIAAVGISLLAGVVVSVTLALRADAAAGRAKTALARLQASAPAVLAQARGLVASGEYDAALAKFDRGIQLQPKVIENYIGRADLLQSQFRFGEAALAYRAALRIDPGFARAESNAALCDRLYEESVRQAELSGECIVELHTVMARENRSPGEMKRVHERLDEITHNVLLEMARGNERLVWKDGEGYWVGYLDNQPVSDLSPLRGLPISELYLAGTQVTDLEPLRGMPLKHLLLPEEVSILSLEPITNLPLKRFYYWGSHPVVFGMVAAG